MKGSRLSRGTGPAEPGYSSRIVGASGVDQAVDVQAGHKSPAIQFAPSGSGVYQLRAPGWQQMLIVPCLGFSAFAINCKGKEVDAAKIVTPIVRIRVFSRNQGLRRLLLGFRVSVPYSIANYHFYEVADAIEVWGNLSDPNPTAAATFYPADMKITVTGLA